MNEKMKNKERILIVDDSEMNRMILADMLEDQYEILEAGQGELRSCSRWVPRSLWFFWTL